MYSIRTIRIILTLLLINNVKGRLRRIFSGREDIYTKYPFVVVIDRVTTNSQGVNVSEAICVGSLLAEMWVLTAASCLQDNIKVRFGSTVRTSSNPGGSVYGTILNKIKHPGALTIDFKHDNNKLNKKMIYKNNIGLIFLDGVHFRESVKLLATDYQSLFGVAVTTVSFAATKRRYGGNFGMDGMSDYLRSFDQGHAIVIKCEGIEGDINPAMCVGKKCGEGREVSANPADIGGPMIYGEKLIGIGSFVYKFSTAYTPVSPYLEWIHDVVINTKPHNGTGPEINTK